MSQHSPQPTASALRAGMGKVVDTPVKTEAKICRLHWSKYSQSVCAR